MSPTAASASRLFERARNILVRPRAEWDRIAAEPASRRSLMLGYVAILAAVPALCRLIGMVLFEHATLLAAVVTTVLAWGLDVISVYLVGFATFALAHWFAEEREPVQALKVAAYAYTAVWAAGVFQLVPRLGFVVVLGAAYAVWLLYLGLGRVMRPQRDRLLVYTGTVAATAVALALVSALIVSALTAGLASMAADLSDIGGPDRPVAVPTRIRTPNGTVDLNRVQQAAETLATDSSTPAVQSGTPGPAATAIAPVALAALLPPTVAGYARGKVSTRSDAAGGLSGSSAEAIYGNARASFTLRITDAGNAAPQAPDAGPEARPGQGFDAQTRAGRYAIRIGDRFSVEAQGEGVDMGVLAAAAHAVSASRLEALARR